jgi:uncharacterized membrane protein YdjX (TVP38/TMEM64 family)
LRASMSAELIVRWLESWGQLDVGAVSALAVVFILAAFVPVPRTFLLLGAGAAFNMKSALVIVPSTTVGCVLAFLLARGTLRDWAERQTGKRPLWRVLAQAIDDQGWRIAALMRFWGPLPNCVQNYLFGLTNIGLLPYSVITAVFTLPQLMLYLYFGASGRSVLLENGELPANRWLIGLALTVVLVIAILVSRRVKVLLVCAGEHPGLKPATEAVRAEARQGTSA